MSYAVNQRFDFASKTLDTVCSLSLISQYIVLNEFVCVLHTTVKFSAGHLELLTKSQKAILRFSKITTVNYIHNNILLISNLKFHCFNFFNNTAFSTLAKLTSSILILYTLLYYHLHYENETQSFSIELLHFRATESIYALFIYHYYSKLS